MKEEALDRTMWRNPLEEALYLSSDRILYDDERYTGNEYLTLPFLNLDTTHR